MRESNIPTPRAAPPISINAFTFPGVSLLDDEHCNAEMAAVTISRKEFLPPEPSFYGDKDRDDYLAEFFEKRDDKPDWGHWQTWQVGILAVAAMRSKLAVITRDVLLHERMSLHVKCSDSCSVVTLSEKDERPLRRITELARSGLSSPSHSQGKSRTSQEKSRKGKFRSPGGAGHASSRDGFGRVGEFALYSRQKLTDGRKMLNFGGRALDEFGLYWLSGPKPQAARPPIDSVRCPEMFDWSDEGVPKGLVEYWKNNPKSIPYGPVARLKPSYLTALRNPS
jgi:hypothetical protein